MKIYRFIAEDKSKGSEKEIVLKSITLDGVSFEELFNAFIQFMVLADGYDESSLKMSLLNLLSDNDDDDDDDDDDDTERVFKF